MNKSEILEKLREINPDPEIELSESTSFVDKSGLDSLDRVRYSFHLDDITGLVISDDRIGDCKTLGDLITLYCRPDPNIDDYFNNKDINRGDNS